MDLQGNCKRHSKAFIFNQQFSQFLKQALPYRKSKQAKNQLPKLLLVEREKMSIVGRVLNDLKRDRVRKSYEEKNRLIDSQLYKELKATKRCMYCKKGFGGGKDIPKIHHIVPLVKGGTNERSNLMAVHQKCHDILDREQGVNWGLEK